MEAAPPSYEHAMLIDCWDLVAPHIPSANLCSASLVCTKWHATFAPHIWGNPASHFGIENDAVHVALTRFRRTLQTARLSVRSLTHTLHLPPAHAELYSGPHSDWLRDVMDRLPNLQSLIVRGLPFFDYAALQALVLMRKKSEERRHRPAGVVELPGSIGGSLPRRTPTIDTLLSFSLRLLDASRCPNVTSNSLAAALSRFESLIYLDLSFTSPARDPALLTLLGKFAGLQVLKLRGVSLKDESIELLARSIGVRVRSLDIRDNQVTDRGVRLLLDHCFARYFENLDCTAPIDTGQRSPRLLPYLGSEMLEIYQGEEFDDYLRNVFTGRFVSRLAIEDAPAGGITHLYIAGNALTVEGVSILVRSGRLHVLDVGSVATAKIRHHSIDGAEWHSDTNTPGVEKLTPILARHAAENMTFLRIDHSIVTKDAPRSRTEEVVRDRVELADTALPLLPSHAAELDAFSIRAEAFELSTEQQTPRYELESDPMLSPAADDTYKIHAPGDDHTQDRDAWASSTSAPEVVQTITKDMRHTHLSSVSASAEGTAATANGGPASVTTPFTINSTVVTSQHISRPRSYSSMGIERRARLKAYTALGNNFHPAMLPHVTTFVLTNVPPFSANRNIADRIICFIKECAEETALARSQAQLDYTLPPGRKNHASALKHSANKLFALRRLVLEMAQDNRPYSNRASPWRHHQLRSMTDDRDSEALWDAAATDFSFFGEEENMFPTIEGGRCAYHEGASEKEVKFGPAVDQHTIAPPAEVIPVDTVAAISEFRKERKLVHQQRQLAAGDSLEGDVDVDGLWDGVVQVVRSNNATMRSGEDLDSYGDTFSDHSFYLYR